MPNKENKKLENLEKNLSKNNFFWSKILSAFDTNKGAIIGTIIGTIIAIGAYSKDSLFFQLFFPENTFGVNIKTTMISPLNQGIGYILDSETSDSIKLMTAVNLLLYLDIKNNTNTNQFLEGIGLECKDSTGEWRELALKKIKSNEGFYFPMNKDSASLITFHDENILDILGKSPTMMPNTMLNGYLMTESFIYSENLKYSPDEFRISFYSGFSKPDTQEFSVKENKKEFHRFRQIEWTPEKKKISLKNYILTSEFNSNPNFELFAIIGLKTETLKSSINATSLTIV